MLPGMMCLHITSLIKMLLQTLALLLLELNIAGDITLLAAASGMGWSLGMGFWHGVVIGHGHLLSYLAPSSPAVLSHVGNPEIVSGVRKFATFKTPWQAQTVLMFTYVAQLALARVTVGCHVFADKGKILSQMANHSLASWMQHARWHTIDMEQLK